jgi:hypothetical protein
VYPIQEKFFVQFHEDFWRVCKTSQMLYCAFKQLPTLLNDGVFFALILEEFLGNVLHDGVEERERQRCGRSCRQKQNVEDHEFTVSFLLSFG